MQYVIAFILFLIVIVYFRWGKRKKSSAGTLTPLLGVMHPRAEEKHNSNKEKR